VVRLQGRMRLSQLFDEPEIRGAVEEAQLRAQERFSTLTPRQREIALLITEGLPNKVIAHRLGISISSVKVHRMEVMRRTDAPSIAALVRLVVLAG